MIYQKLQEAKEILESLGLPSAQQNDISAFTFLALCGVGPEDDWKKASRTSLSVRKGIMEFIAVQYDRHYKENTRESFRKNVLHQFHQAKVVEYNPDNPALPTNSPHAHYAISEAALRVAQTYGRVDWKSSVEEFSASFGSLTDKYSRHKPKDMVPVTLPNGKKYKLSPGKHNQLQASIVQDFAPRFASGAHVLYLGDTMDKGLHIESKYLQKLGIPINHHDKLPDVVLHHPSKDWLFLVEAVTSVGPMSPKRIIELEEMLKNCKAGRVFVTAFLDFTEYRKRIKEIAWETEVWIAEVPDHLIHYNGDRFFGPR